MHITTPEMRKSHKNVDIITKCDIITYDYDKYMNGEGGTKNDRLVPL